MRQQSEGNKVYFIDSKFYQANMLYSRPDIVINIRFSLYQNTLLPHWYTINKQNYLYQYARHHQNCENQDKPAKVNSF